jgi:hypothetical protein
LSFDLISRCDVPEHHKFSAEKREGKRILGIRFLLMKSEENRQREERDRL